MATLSVRTSKYARAPQHPRLNAARPVFHNLRYYGARRSSHRRWILIFHLLRRLGEDKGLIGIYEQDHNTWWHWGIGQRRVEDVSRLRLQNGNRRYVFLPNIAKLAEYLKCIHQVGLLSRRRLQVVSVYPMAHRL